MDQIDSSIDTATEHLSLEFLQSKLLIKKCRGLLMKYKLSAWEYHH